MTDVEIVYMLKEITELIFEKRPPTAEDVHELIRVVRKHQKKALEKN